MNFHKNLIIFKFLLFYLLSILFVLGDNKFKLNNSLILNSVYDSIRHNNNNVNGLSDYRDKRNINERGEYYNYKQNDWTPSASSHEISCLNFNNEKHAKISIMDNLQAQSVSNFIFTISKFILSALALIMLPMIIIHALVLPWKILMTIKTITIANGMLMGYFFYKLINRNNNSSDDSNENNDNEDDNNNNTESDNGVITNSNYENLNEQNIDRILKFIKEKNKNW